MELIERLPINKIQYLSQLTFPEFLRYCSESGKNKEERMTQHQNLIRFCNGHIKAKAQMTRIYAFTERTPNHIGGRLYCGNSLQSLPKQFRGFLCSDTMTDIDMKNAHPTIARYLCKLHGIPCPNLSYYIENRDEILLKFGDDGKEKFLKALNDEKLNKKETDKFFKDFDKECKHIQTQITSLDEFSYIIKNVPETRIYNWLGSAFNRILCVYENKILHSLISVLNSNQIETAALCFDGLLMYGNYYDDDKLLTEVTHKINQDWVGLNMKWSFKKHDSSIIIPDDWEPPSKTDESELVSFKTLSDEFEKTHCKITNLGMFVKTETDKDIIMTKSHLTIAYEHMTFDAIVKGEATKVNFIQKWVQNNPSIKIRREIQIIPPDLPVPNDIYNAWREFKMVSVQSYVEKKEAVKMILNHIMILCNHEQYCYDYFTKWIACLIQFPSIKLPMPVFISREGGGKGSLLRLFASILGGSKILQTQEPSKEVWGEFNALMLNAYLVCLDEISKKEMTGCEGKIKGLITEPTIRINDKGKSRFEVPSYHKFIAFANPDAYGNEPMNTTDGDRRKFFVQCSDELVENKSYFDKFYETLSDIDSMKTVYEYFNTLPDAKAVLKMPLPVTEYNKGLKEMAEPPLKLFIRDFISKNTEPLITTSDLFYRLKDWTSQTGIRYECNVLQFACRLSNMKIAGMEKKENIGMLKVKGWAFDIKKCREAFGLERVENEICEMGGDENGEDEDSL